MNQGCPTCGKSALKCQCYEKAFGTPVSDAAPDMVNHPPHYAEGHPEGIECIQITRYLTFNVGNAVKYCWRARKKDPAKEIEDLKKAVFYLNDEIRRLEGKVSAPVEAKQKAA